MDEEKITITLYKDGDGYSPQLDVKASTRGMIYASVAMLATAYFHSGGFLKPQKLAQLAVKAIRRMKVDQA